MKIIKTLQRQKIVVNDHERVYVIDATPDGGVEIAATHMGGYRKVLFRAPNLTQLCQAIRSSGLLVEKIYVY